MLKLMMMIPRLGKFVSVVNSTFVTLSVKKYLTTLNIVKKKFLILFFFLLLPLPLPLLPNSPNILAHNKCTGLMLFKKNIRYE